MTVNNGVAARRQQRDVLQACRMSASAFDKFGSGEALEEMLWHQPCTLVQIDELQRMLAGMADERNTNAQGKADYLMSLFTKSATTYTLRPKATMPNEIGRTIDCSSLSLFAVGVIRGVYQALTPRLIEEGLVGRCLIFDTEVEGV